MAVTVKIDGLRELEKALSELPKATGKSVLRRVLVKRAQPVADAMRALTPDDPATGGYDLKRSIAVGTKLSRRQAKLHRAASGGGPRMTAAGWRADPKTAVEAFVGAGPLPHAHMQEFGTIDDAPQPFARPGWDATKAGVLDGLKDDLWAEIEKSAKRLARKRAKAAAKGG